MLKLNYKIPVFILCALCLILPKFAKAEEVLTWQDCVNEAVKNNPELLAAAEAVVQSRADRNSSISNILPQVSSQLSGKESKSAGSDKTDTYAYSISAQQLIFDGFKTTSNIQSAVKTLNAQEYTYMVTSSNIRLSLRTAFAALLRAQELVSLTEEIAKRRNENLELVKVRYDAGREHKGALLTAEADLAQAEFEVSQAKRNLSLVQQELARELGRDKEDSLFAVGSFFVENSEKTKPDFAALADNTPFLKELIAKKEAARFDYNAAKAEFLPEVYLSGSLGRSDSDWPPKDETWSAGLTVSLPIFEGGNRVFQTAKAKSQLTQALENERGGKDSVIYTLEKTWKDFQDAAQTVSVKKKFLDAATERAKISNAQYASGLATFDDWVIIEDNLVSARKSYLDARENLLTAEAYWIQAKGGTLEYVKK